MSKDNLRDDRENISKKPGLPSSNSTGSPNNKEYNSITSDRFYTLKEEVTLRFYQVPKALFKNPKYKGLSLGPKLMYSILRDRLDLSIKNNWKDEKGYIYLIFSGEDLINLLEVSKNTVTKYKRELVKHRLIINKRLGQGKSNIIYVLKPEIKEFLNPKNWESRIPKNTLLESQKIHPNDTNVNEPNLNNVNRAGSKEVVENSKGEIKETVTEDEEDINDIRRKIKESLEENRKCNFTELENSGKERKLSKNNSDLKGRYSKDRKEGEYS